MSEQRFAIGDEVQIIRPVENEGGRSYMPGLKAVVEDYVPKGSESAEGGPAFYWLTRHHGMGSLWAYEDYLVLARTRAQLAARRIPTYEDVIKALPLSWNYQAGFEMDEKDPSSESNEVEFYGETEDGLRFGVRIEVMDIWEMYN